MVISQLIDSGYLCLLAVYITVGLKVVIYMIDSDTINNILRKSILTNLSAKILQVPPLKVALADG